MLAMIVTCMNTEAEDTLVCKHERTSIPYSSKGECDLTIHVEAAGMCHQ